MLRYAGMCHGNWLVFHKKILGSRSHFPKKIEKIVMSAIFEEVKPLEVSPNLQTIAKTVKSAIPHVEIYRYQKQNLIC